MRLSRGRPGRTYLAGAPLLVAHRGGSRLAPENTLEAFRDAVERWRADMLEMDVRLTRDGEVVVIHDETVDRTTDGTGPVRSYTLEELQRLDAAHRFVDPRGEASFRGKGVRIPRFEDVLLEELGPVIGGERDDPALGIVGVRFLGPGVLGDDDGAEPGVGRLEGRGGAGDAATDDQDVGPDVGRTHVGLNSGNPGRCRRRGPSGSGSRPR